MTYIQRWDKNPGGVGGTATDAFEMEMSAVTGLAYVEHPYFWRIRKNGWGQTNIFLMKRHRFWWPTVVLERNLLNHPLFDYAELDPENIAYQSARALSIHQFSHRYERRVTEVTGDYPPKKLKMGE